MPRPRLLSAVGGSIASADFKCHSRGKFKQPQVTTNKLSFHLFCGPGNDKESKHNAFCDLNILVSIMYLSQSDKWNLH